MAEQCKGLGALLFGNSHRYRIEVDERGMYLCHVCKRCGHKIIKER